MLPTVSTEIAQQEINIRLDRIRDIDEFVLDPVVLGKSLAEPPDAECLGRVVARGDEVDAGLARVTALTGREPLHVTAGPDPVRTIGIVSGAGTDYVNDAIALGLDCFLTGEPAERAFGTARDNDVRFIAAGHHATETFGVRRLGDLLAERFGVRHVFVDVPNPI